jgi:RND family efflux transporter MFP subunit
MTKYLLSLLPILAIASNIEMSHSILKPLGKVVHTNAKITQLSNQKQEIVSRLSGHVEAFYVKAGEHVNSRDKVALIESIALSKLSADYLALKAQMIPAQRQVNSTRKLYKKGLSSKNTLTTAELTLETLRSQKNALASQLHTLGIDASSLTTATDKLILYAHAEGTVGKILVSLHSNVDAQTPLMTLVQNSGYYATAFLSVDDAMQINPKTTGNIFINKQAYPCYFIQLLPTIDEETQRAKVRFRIEKSPKNLLLGTFTQMDIALPSQQKAVMVKKSALTLYQGEWVVFVEAHHDEEMHEDEEKHKAHAHEAEHNEERHDEPHKEDVYDKDIHTEHDHTEDHSDEKHSEEKHETDEEDTHEGHGDDAHEEEVPYKAKVIEIIAYNGDEVAIKGLNAGEEYVSEGVYFVKSMLLKSSLGGHGH